MAENLDLITAKGKLDDGGEVEASFVYEFPRTAAEAIDLLGDAVVLDGAVRSWRIAAQAAMRNHLKAGKTADEVAEYMASNWKPGVAVSDPTVAFINKMNSVDPEERAEILAKLQAQWGL